VISKANTPNNPGTAEPIVDVVDLLEQVDDFVGPDAVPVELGRLFNHVPGQGIDGRRQDRDAFGRRAGRGQVRADLRIILKLSNLS
jgi:hypothetical protein